VGENKIQLDKLRGSQTLAVTQIRKDNLTTSNYPIGTAKSTTQFSSIPILI